MKKYLLVCLALVALLATMGVGYSMWSQSVTINGSVSTGNVSVTVANPSQTYVYKDTSTDALVNSGTPLTGANDLLVGSATWGNTVFPQTCTNDGGITLTATYAGLFPMFSANGAEVDWCVDFDLTNAGSIPIKAEVLANNGILPTVAASGPVLPSFHFTVTTTGANHQTIDLEGYQLEPGDTVHVNICLDVNENTMQSYTGSFNIQIKWVQWNEYNVYHT